MESRVNYTVVGIFVVGLSIAMTIVFLWLSSLRSEKSYKTYLLYVSENVTGLTVQSPVRYNGVPVGYVKSIELDPHNARLVKIILRIEVGTPITTSTVAILQTQGITGVMYVGLKTIAVDAPLLQPAPGERYAIIPTRPSFFVQISEVLPEVTKSIKKIGDSINKLLNEKNQKAISETLENLRIVTGNLSRNSKNLDASIKSLRITLENTAAASASIKNFSIQTMPDAQRAVQNFSHAARSVDQLADQVDQNPSMLIRGKKQPPKGPGEK